MSIVVNEAAITLLGNCAACGGIIDEDTAAMFDWVDTVIIHKSIQYDCINRYIQQYIHTHPSASITETMSTFGISRPTVMRCRRSIKESL